MKELSRSELLQFVGKEMKVVCVNNGILRSDDCAYWIAENESSAKAFFESMKEQLPDDAEFSTVILNIEDISTFSMLFDSNYYGFNIVGHGFVFFDELFERFPEMSAKMRDALVEEGCLYIPEGENGKFVVEKHGKLHVIQSFYSTEDAAAAYGKPVTIMIEDLLRNMPKDVNCFTLDGEVLYGYDFYQGIVSAWRHLHLSFEQTDEMVQDKPVIVLEAADVPGKYVQFCERPLIFLDKEVAEEYCESNKERFDYPVKVVTVENTEDALSAVFDDYRDTYIMLAGNETALTYSSDIFGLKTDIGFITDGLAVDTVLNAADGEMYILTSAKKDRKGLPFLMPRQNRTLGIVLFFEKEEAFKYIKECGMEAEVGLIDNSKPGKDLTTLALIASHLDIGDLEFCYEAPVDDYAAAANCSLEVSDVLDFLDVFDRRISMISSDPDAQIEFNRYEIVTE